MGLQGPLRVDGTLRGVGAAQAPVALSPLYPETDRHAQSGRDEVRATRRAKRNRFKVRAGDVVEFDEPVEFSEALKSRRFEAFAYRRNGRSRAQILCRTLDTRHAPTARIGPKALQGRGARLVARTEDAKVPADA